jgi:hypothetical protein
MLDIALGFLMDELNGYIEARTGATNVRATVTRLADETGKYAFPLERIGISLVNVEEERTFREQLPSHVLVNGQHVVREPALKLNLHLLAAAHFQIYDEALKYLACVLTYFQSHSSFTAARYPALDPRIEKLNVELQSPTFEQLNQIWGFVGAKQLPSALYKVRMVVLQDVDMTRVQPPLTAINSTVAAV